MLVVQSVLLDDDPRGEQDVYLFFRCSQAGWEERRKETSLHKTRRHVHKAVGTMGGGRTKSYLVGQEGGAGKRQP